MRLTPTPHGVTWAWMTHAAALDCMLWPVVVSAASLLTSQEAGRVKECVGRACAWLFLDTTKNRSRRYCRAEGCGNRARARRHYARTRAAAHE
jgi:predicted RNA-binding Zn ribbon-like protein